MNTPKFTGLVKNGELVYHKGQEQYLKNWLLTLEGKQFVLQVKKLSPQRTLPQNAYLHGVVFKYIADDTGNNLKTVKDTMKDMFASHKDEKGFYHVESTSKMNTERMSEFIEDICRWAATEINLYIPPPGE